VTGPTGKLICLHHAGGEPAVFDPWRRRTPPGLQLVPLELPTVGTGPGRRRRFRTTESLVPVLARRLAAEVADGPYVVFGHSMGALLAYLLTRWFAERDGPLPRALVVACLGAPGTFGRDLDRRQAEHGGLIPWLHHIGGVPDWLAAEPALLEPHLGVTRDDIELCRGHRQRPVARPLTLPVHVFGATEDRLVDAADLRGWRRIGTDVRVSLLPGSHHLVSDTGGVLCERVLSLAARAVREPAPVPLPRGSRA
jgi:surfactin synthase thioesterase subunit